MYELENDDELLLLELERRDGIYSFIFHEMEDQNDNNKENDTTKETKQTQIEKTMKKSVKDELKLDVIMPSLSSDSPAPHTNSTCLFAKGNSSSSKVSTTNGDKNNRNLDYDLYKIWQHPPPVSNGLSFNFSFQMNGTSNHSRFKSPSTNKPWQVRQAKPSFSHVYAPLVRNRRHKLKETEEYKNFEKDLTNVADLRHLFPLDPDVYAPFSEVHTDVRKAKTNGVIVEMENLKNSF